MDQNYIDIQRLTHKLPRYAFRSTYTHKGIKTALPYLLKTTVPTLDSVSHYIMGSTPYYPNKFEQHVSELSFTLVIFAIGINLFRF